ncbi:MAG: tRNA pseudouridine(38-40) synthase TruA [Lachnospiraceae bacterium]|nr:tRNA pseudouridine(38-40) synthase TruA [Lachnospiraceae bacterium]
MKNYKMVLQYEGTRYQGWQKQESTANTIQGKLEAILTKMTGVPTEIQGSGRTDAGVHALGQVANFHIEERLVESGQLTVDGMMKYINCYLPEDIAVISLEEVPERFHSRLNAREKTYCYRVLNSDIPHIFDRRYVFEMPEKLDIPAMREAAAVLVGEHDFKSFTSNKRGKKSTVRCIREIRIERVEDEIRFTYRGNGFLYHMVRILTGTLLEVGRGERRPEEMQGILNAKNRECAGCLVPGKGLTLVEVKY